MATEPATSTAPPPVPVGPSPEPVPPTPPTAAADAPPGDDAEYSIGYYSPPSFTYPPLARERREEGTVLVTVDVSPTGEATRAVIHTSSGSASLDAAALEEIKNYRFVPRRRGQTPIAGTIDVPVVYSLTGLGGG